MPMRKTKYEGISATERNRLIFVENRLKVLSTLSQPSTFTEAYRRIEDLSETKFNEHLQRAVSDGLVNKAGKKYKLTRTGAERIMVLKEEIEKIAKTWKKRTVVKELLRQSVTVTSGQTQTPKGVVDYMGSAEIWAEELTSESEKQWDVASTAINEAVKSAMAAMTELPGGLSTVKLSITINYWGRS